MAEKCRICLSDSSWDLFKRLTDNHGGRAISNLLTFLSGIQIKIEEGLPGRICASCLRKLLAATELKQQIVHTEKILRESFSGTGYIEDDEPQPGSFSTLLYPIEQVIVDECDIHRSNKRALITNPPEKKNKRPNKLDYKCHICNVSFTKVGEKNLHVKLDHVSDSLCHICWKKCKTPMSLETHIKFHFKLYDFMCEICSKTFRYSNRLEIHMKLHHSRSSMFSCDLCGLQTKFKNNIKRHTKVHMRLFSCSQCPGNEYSTQIALNGHISRCHDGLDSVECRQCSLRFDSLDDLRSHETQANCTAPSHLQKRDLPGCDYLKIGLDSDLVCKHCGESFQSREKGRIHFYLKHKHSNKCDECDIVFNNFPALTRHRRVKHQGHKPFKCDICEKTFGQKVSLVSHRNSHTKEKPFSCPHCHYRSGDYSSMSKHKKRVHPEIWSSKV